jgi:predicted nucleic acid-binding protein
LKVFVESNFVLELALQRKDHESCTTLLDLAAQGRIAVFMPAFCVGETYGAIRRQANARNKLGAELVKELGELARSRPYSGSRAEFQGLIDLLLQVKETEREQLNEALHSQGSLGLSPQDSMIYASVLARLETDPAEASCFVTQDSDFSIPDVKRALEGYRCKLLPRFSDAVRYSVSH